MTTQISAHISDETKVQLEAFVKSRGITRARLIEDALQHHPQALREIPDDVVVPFRLLVSDVSMERLVKLIESGSEPSPGLRELMHSGKS